MQLTEAGEQFSKFAAPKRVAGQPTFALTSVARVELLEDSFIARRRTHAAGQAQTSVKVGYPANQRR